MSKLVLRYLFIILSPMVVACLIRATYVLYKWVFEIAKIPEATKMAEACITFLIIILISSIFVDYTYRKKVGGENATN